MQGFFVVTHKEKHRSPQQAKEISDQMFNLLIPLSKHFGSEIIASMVAVVLMRGSLDCQEDGEVLSIAVYGFTFPFSPDALAKMSKRQTEAEDEPEALAIRVGRSPSPPPRARTAVAPPALGSGNDVVVVVSDSDDDTASRPAQHPAPAPAPPPPSPPAATASTTGAEPAAAAGGDGEESGGDAETEQPSSSQRLGGERALRERRSARRCRP